MGKAGSLLHDDTGKSPVAKPKEAAMSTRTTHMLARRLKGLSFLMGMTQLLAVRAAQSNEDWSVVYADFVDACALVVGLCEVIDAELWCRIDQAYQDNDHYLEEQYDAYEVQERDDRRLAQLAADKLAARVHGFVSDVGART